MYIDARCRSYQVRFLFVAIISISITLDKLPIGYHDQFHSNGMSGKNVDNAEIFEKIHSSFVAPCRCLVTLFPKQLSSATTYFWNRDTLKVSSDISDFGASFNFWLLLCHVIAWVLVFGVVVKGVESTGKGESLKCMLMTFCAKF